jgi:hypothetical protein
VDHFCGAGTAVPKQSVLRQQRQVTLAGPSCLRRNAHRTLWPRASLANPSTAVAARGMSPKRLIQVDPTGGLVDELSRTSKPALPDDQNLVYAGVADQFNAVAVS